MNMNEIRALAKAKGASVARLRKAEAIRAIQLAEGHFDCYGKAGQGYCDQGDCLFMDDCMEESAKAN